MVFKGNIPWNKGKTGTFKHSEEHKKRISALLKGRKKPDGFNVGRKHSEETKRKIGAANHIALLGKPNGRTGAKNNMWKGGKSSPNEKFRKSVSYKLWRKAIFERDDYTCKLCLIRGGKLNADHIKPFAYIPELRLALDNGRTLCEDCHRKTDTYSRRYKPNKI